MTRLKLRLIIVMSFQQLKCRLDQVLAQNNELKLNLLNKERSIISNSNKLTFYKRFTILLSTGEIPRLQQLVKVAFCKGVSISTIVDRLNSAYKGTYKPKGFTQIFLPKLSNLLNQSDYQNVKAAVELLNGLKMIQNSDITFNHLSQEIK